MGLIEAVVPCPVFIFPFSLKAKGKAAGYSKGQKNPGLLAGILC